MRPKIRFACSKSWSELDGDGPSRHCEDCGHRVQNYSLLTPAEAARVVAKGQRERVCLFGLADAQGQLIPREELPQAALRWLRARAGVASTAAALGLAVQPTACDAQVEGVPHAAMMRAMELAEVPQATPVEPVERPVQAKIAKLERLASPVEPVTSPEDWEDLLAIGGYIEMGIIE